MTASLSLKKRAAELGGHISGRTEYHGDDPVGACDLLISGLLLDAEELDKLCGDGTWNRLYKKTRNSGMNDFPEPAEFIAATKLPLQLESKFEGARVTLYMGIDNEDKVELVKCTLAKIKYEPQSGGMTLLSLRAQCNAEPEQVAVLYQHMDSKISASVRFGKLVEDDDENQDELPLDATRPRNGAAGEEAATH